MMQIRFKLPLSAGQLSRAAVELAKLWRTDKYLRKLDVSSLYCHVCPMLGTVAAYTHI